MKEKEKQKFCYNCKYIYKENDNFYCKVVSIPSTTLIEGIEESKCHKWEKGGNRRYRPWSKELKNFDNGIYS